MDEERYLILKMLEEGRLSAEEASALLEALDAGDPGRPDEAGQDGASREGREGRERRERRERERWSGGSRRAGSHRDRHEFHYAFDRSDLRDGLEEMRRQVEKLRLGAIDIGDEVSRQVRGVMDSCRDEWRRTGNRPFRHFVRDIGDIFSVPAGKEMYEESYEREVEAQPDGRVEIRGLSGDVSVDTWDRNAVRVQARKRTWAATKEEAEERAADYVIQVEREGEVVSIGARLRPDAPGWLPARCGIDYRLLVPPGSFVAVSLTNGDVKVTGVRRGVALKSTNGEVTGVRLGGSIGINTVNGDVDLRKAEPGDLDVRSVNGDVRLELQVLGAAENTVKAVRGDVKLVVPADLVIDLRATTMHGDIRGEFTRGVSNRSSTRLDVRLGEPAASGDGAYAGGEAPALEIRTLFGDVLVERQPENGGPGQTNHREG